ncbi:MULTISPECIES: type I methionyl aminopeptidase [Acinetobacter]|jgi:methionyl aminopeptidase|uniref:Methionine aminopeptidase n=2 Tax=Acinetobacter calcoaceticus/baumannii complex TaxID=909768 RepID=A0A0U2CJ06_ACIBA|nr:MULTISPECIES: type I methionyl aminopeptidase [Acinetobacter]AKJ75398.1 methionine aminopeptidase, type I [Acinetobacter baumannii]AUO31901.1 Methionine aminopeptidase, type I [Acinetobacter baumannii]AVR61220.1 Methionine aminopeptidase (type I) [Acinetobacter baumannii]ENW91488.1 methionine aminopeptidase, type I [Acinetobacter sp. CIP 53.82]MBA0157198.1 type I methionyl aminopeptidase [Acinetobacter indicus]
MIKNESEIKLMRESGRLLSLVFDYINKLNLLGKSTFEINNIVEKYIIEELCARPASKGQYGFKYVLNPSINDVVCHAIPSEKEILKDGDIINLDITLEKNGYIADSSKTYLIGNVSLSARRLVDTTYEALWKGIAQVKPGAKLGDIGYAIERHAKKNGYTVVKEYCGHGIGKEMHEEPAVLHYGTLNTGIILQEGMTFTIEPMLNQGRRATFVCDDGWTVKTRDHKLSAQFEHTVLVTKDGVEVLTLRKEELKKI